jgi:hypothetical protein
LLDRIDLQVTLATVSAATLVGETDPPEPSADVVNVAMLLVGGSAMLAVQRCRTGAPTAPAKKH